MVNNIRNILIDLLKGMQLYVKVIELNSFSAAAEELNLANSTISKQIKNMEEKLSAQLIFRTTRKIRATEVGIKFYDHCVNILNSVNSAMESVKLLDNQPSGFLRLTAPNSFSKRYLAQAIAIASKKFPELKIELYPDDLVVDIIKGGYDLTIRTGELVDSTYVAQRLFSSRMVLCASPEYIKSAGEPQEIDCLDQFNCLTYKQNGEPLSWSFHNKLTNEYTSKSITGSIKSDSCDFLCQVSISGEGIVYLPYFIVQSYIKSGELVELLKEEKGTFMPINVVYPPGRSRPEKVRSFVNILKMVLEKEIKSHELFYQ